MSTLICQLPTIYSRDARFTRTILPSYMRSSICSSQKGAITEAVATSVKALERATESVGLPASIQVTSGPIPNGAHGERLSVLLDMPTPAWDAGTFRALQNRFYGDWDKLDFNAFSDTWMGKRFLPIDNYEPIVAA